MTDRHEHAESDAAGSRFHSARRALTTRSNSASNLPTHGPNRPSEPAAESTTLPAKKGIVRTFALRFES